MKLNTKTKIKEALSIYFNQLVYIIKDRGQKVITLSLGEAYFNLPRIDFSSYSPDKIVHYTSSRGSVGFREKIASMYKDLYYSDINPEEEIIVTAGSKIAVYMSMLALTEQKDAIGIIEPAWLSYSEQAIISDRRPINIAHDKNLDEICEAIKSENIKCIILNNPNNPGGFVYSKDFILNLIKYAEKHECYVVFDEAYSDFVLDDSFYSGARVFKDFHNVVVINSFSKNLGVSGWRCGYIITNSDLSYEFLKLNQHLITCAPSLVQQYLEDNLDDLLKETLPQCKESVLKRQKVCEYLDTIGLNYIKGNSTFYIFIKIDSKIEINNDFFIKLLLIDNISVVPGNAYGDSVNQFCRISIGTESLRDIKNALDILKHRSKNGWSDEESVTSLLNRLELPVLKD